MSDKKGVTLESTPDEQAARELAAILMRQAATVGPVARIRELNRLLRILRMAMRIVTGERDRTAYSAGAVYSYETLGKHANATRSTMQRWSESGRKAVEAQQVSRETMPANAQLNSVG